MSRTSRFLKMGILGGISAMKVFFRINGLSHAANYLEALLLVL